MKKAKRILVLFLAVLMLTSLLPGCSTSTTQPEQSAQTGESTQPTASGLEYVKLTWYYRSDSYPEQQEVFDAFNAILLEKINTEIDFIPIAPSDYEQKMQTKYAAGNAGDLNYTASWTNNYNNNVSKGAFCSLEDLLKTYAPETYGYFTADQWNAMRINGEIYGVPNAQVFTHSSNLIVRKDIADKYDFDVSAVTSFVDLEPLLAQTSANDGMVYELYGAYGGGFMNLKYAYGFDDLQGCFGIRYDDPTLTALCMFNTDEFADYCHIIKGWADNGYIAADALVLTEQSTDKMAGKIAAAIGGTYQPNNEAQEALAYGDGVEVYQTLLGESILTTSGFTATITAIPASSQYPERAMMVINLMNTDAELFNLISFGIEGQHYTKNDDGTITLINTDKYMGLPWMMGNTFLSYTMEGKPLDFNDGIVELNNTATPSQALGFTFDSTPVKTQLAQVQTVIDEYYPSLNCGAVDDVDAAIATFLEKLEAAGSSEIVAEMQSQLTAWSASK